MAILKSTQIKGDLSVTGSLNVQGNLTYVGVENLRVKDHQIELNADESGSAIVGTANGAGIVIRGARNTQDVNDDASILYDSSDDTLVVNKTIKGTVASANNAASANKVANTLTVKVKKKGASEEETESVVFDGSAAKTVNIDLKALQDQIDGMSGATGSVATQINNAIGALDVTDAAVVGQYVSSVSETDGKISVSRAALPDYTEVYDAKGAADAVLGKAGDDSTVNTVYGVKAYAKEYADGLAGNYAAASHNHEISNVNGLQAALDGKAAKSHTHVVANITDLQGKLDAKQNNLSEAQLAAVNSGITADKVSTLESASHTHSNQAELNGIKDGDVAKWNAAEQNANKYTNDEIKKLGLGTAAKKNVLTGTIADSSSEDLVTAAQVKTYTDDASAAAVAKVVAGAPESFDTLKEVADWIANNDHASDVTTLMTDVENLKKIDHNAYVAADETVLASAKSYVDGLASNYAAAKHTHEIADVTGLQNKLDGKAAVDHNHDDVYSKPGHTHATSEITGLDTALAGKQDNLSEAQLNAVNSDITKAKVDNYEAHVKDSTKHITADERKAWSTAEANAKNHADKKVAELKTTVDNLSNDALKGVAAGTYVSVSTKLNNSQTISVTTKGVATASGSDNGLALAADVKKYVDDKNALQDDNITGIRNSYVQKAGDTMTGKLIMNAADIEMSSNGTNGIVFGNMKIVWKDNAIEFIPTTA